MFVEKALNPVAFTDERSREKYNYLLEGTNKALMLAGLEITKEGRLIEVVQAMSHIRKIREKIEDNPSKPIYIQTVWGVGYRFNQNLSSGL